MLDDPQKRAIQDLREKANYLSRSTADLKGIVNDYINSCQFVNQQISKSSDARLLDWLPRIKENLDWLAYLASSVQVTAAEQVIDLYKAGTPVEILKISKAQEKKRRNQK